MEDKRELLNQPIHGIYIPIGLILFGTWIFGWEYMPYSIGFIVVIVSIQYYGALKRASSMHQVKWQEFELLDKTLIAPMTSIYRFKLRREDEVLDIPTGHSLACCFNVDGKDEVRFYTPISNQFDKGFFDILVKHYEHGVVTKKLANLQVGQTVQFRGPFGKLQYVPNLAKELALVAGGTGITPMLQVITAIITNLEDDTKIKLLFANNTERDILLKDELDNMAQKYPGLEIKYVTGKFVDKKLFEFLPSPTSDSKIFICGPPAFVEYINEMTKDAGFEKDQVFCF